jgi:hypothetical protein
MDMHETHGALETMTRFIQFEINKHGHCGHANTVEEAVNALSNFELLELVADHLDAAAARMPAHIAEFQERYTKLYGHPAELVSGSTGATRNYQLLRGFLLGKGYSFAEIDAQDGLWALTRSAT